MNRYRKFLRPSKKRSAQATKAVNAAGKAPRAQHTKDSDCTVDLETLCCTICGVDHSGECLDCGGRGFHKPECPWMQDEPEQPELNQVAL